MRLILMLALLLNLGWVIWISPLLTLQTLALLISLLLFQLIGGAMGWKAIHSFTGGQWFESLSSLSYKLSKKWWWVAVPLGVVSLFLIFTSQGLYPWQQPLNLSEHPHWKNRALYFSSELLFFRILIYVLGLAFVGQCLFSSKFGQWMKGLGTFVLALILTGVGIDFLMSLDIQWHSTIFGTHMALKSLNLFLIVALLKRPKALSPQIQRDLGNLLLVVTMIWAYFHVSQFLIIWSGQIPYEENWYKLRFEGPLFLGAGLIFGLGFIIPFFLLLFRKFKESQKAMSLLALILLLSHWLEYLWIILPTHEELNPYAWSLLTIWIGGLIFFYFRGRFHVDA